MAGPGMDSFLRNRSEASTTVQQRCAWDETMRAQLALRLDPICTKSPGTGGGGMGIGFFVCGSRQLSSIATCCTQETVQRGPQYLSVRYSRSRISGVYCARGIPGYPRCCEHQCTKPSSQMYK